jgi:hypothetical protein
VNILVYVSLISDREKLKFASDYGYFITVIKGYSYKRKDTFCEYVENLYSKKRYPSSPTENTKSL